MRRCLGSIWLTLGTLGIGHLKATKGHLMATIGQLRVTIGYLRVTITIIGYVRVT